MKKIVLWGIGRDYNYYLNNLKHLEKLGQIRILAITASDVYMSFLDGYKVIKPEEINKIDYDYIFIMSEKRYKEIVDIATNNYGIARNRCVNCKILKIPNININDYFKLYESKLSIISNNCWGGMIYNTLGMECTSPFKNLFLKDSDYIKLISDFVRYMKISPVFDHYEEEIHSHIMYPVLRLEDIEIHCNHTTNENEAIYDWDRRKKKFNYDNVFIEMFTLDRIIAKKYVELKGKRGGICFVPYETCEAGLMTLKAIPEQQDFYETVNRNAALDTYGLQYNIVDLLLGKKCMRFH